MMFPVKSISGFVFTGLLLGAMAIQSSLYPTGEKASAYHARVKKAAYAIPTDIGPWDAQRTPIPPAATKLLRPNVTISRQYTNSQTGQVVKLLMVQCTDARDMEGHYPANCYPAFGWTQGSSKPFSLDIGHTRVTGQTYRFNRDLGMREAGITVMNVILLPQGKFGKGMDDIQALAASYSERFYGAGQIQLIFDQRWSDQDRRAVAKRFLKSMDDLINTMLGQQKAKR